jgi:hypothetical protein
MDPKTQSLLAPIQAPKRIENLGAPYRTALGRTKPFRWIFSHHDTFVLAAIGATLAAFGIGALVSDYSVLTLFRIGFPHPGLLAAGAGVATVALARVRALRRLRAVLTEPRERFEYQVQEAIDAWNHMSEQLKLRLELDETGRVRLINRQKLLKQLAHEKLAVLRDLKEVKLMRRIRGMQPPGEFDRTMRELGAARTKLQLTVMHETNMTDEQLDEQLRSLESAQEVDEE